MESGHKAYYIEVKVREDCLLKAARAYMVFDVLERNGEVVKSYPSVQEIEQEQFDRGFSVYYISQVEANELKDQISRVSEIESVVLNAVDKDSLAEMEQSQAAVAQSEKASLETAASAAPASNAPAATPSPSAENNAPRPAAAAQSTEARRRARFASISTGLIR